MNKYRNRKTVVDGITFDSKREAERYMELKLLEQAGLRSPFEDGCIEKIVEEISLDK